jgi:hypothetical protein
MQEASFTLYRNLSVLCFDPYYTSEHLCVSRPKFTCGAAGSNTTLSYNRRLSDLNSSALFNTTISIAWDPLEYFVTKEDYTISFYDFEITPQDEWLNVSHVYDKPGVYTPIWWISHAPPRNELSAQFYNCMNGPFYDRSCDGTLDRIVVNSNNCSIEPPESGGHDRLTSLALLAAIVAGHKTLLLV